MSILQNLIDNIVPTSGKSSAYPSEDDFSLAWFAEHGHFAICEYLLENGADVHIFDDLPLRCACYNGHLNIVKLLVNYGADISAYNYDAIHKARKYGHKNVVKYLAEIKRIIRDRKNDKKFDIS